MKIFNCEIKPLKIKICAAYAGAIVLGLVTANFIFNFLENQKHPAKKPESEIITTAKEETPPQALTTPQPPVMPLEESPAPLKEENLDKEVETLLTLNGIFVAENGCYAIINNQVVKKNDSVGNVIIMQITAEEVELQRSNGEKFKLSIKGSGF